IGSPKTFTPKCYSVMSEKDEKLSKGSLNSPITRKIFDGSLLVFALLALAAGLAVWFWKGPVAFDRAVDDAWALFQFIMPRVGAAVLIAAFLQLLIPREVVSRLIGDQAGIKSVVIATIAGALTPGGPLTSFPVVVALYVSGANKGALVAYISAWAMIGFQRILVWELPLMGEEFTAIRVGASVLLPVICGTVALYLPIKINLPEKN
ncbi:MAG: permease, partial [Pseudomonadota bacterium]|nr:permease [Pseudomonadota bacterium]